MDENEKLFALLPDTISYNDGYAYCHICQAVMPKHANLNARPQLKRLLDHLSSHSSWRVFVYYFKRLWRDTMDEDGYEFCGVCMYAHKRDRHHPQSTRTSIWQKLKGLFRANRSSSS